MERTQLRTPPAPRRPPNTQFLHNCPPNPPLFEPKASHPHAAPTTVLSHGRERLRGPRRDTQSAAEASHRFLSAANPPAPQRDGTARHPRTPRRGPTGPPDRSAEGPTPPARLGMPSGRGARQRLKARSATPRPSRPPCAAHRPAPPRSPVDAIFSPSSSALPTSGRRGRRALRMRGPARRDVPLRGGGVGGEGQREEVIRLRRRGALWWVERWASPPALSSGWCGPPPLRSVAQGRCEGRGVALRRRGFKEAWPVSDVTSVGGMGEAAVSHVAWGCGAAGLLRSGSCCKWGSQW